MTLPLRRKRQTTRRSIAKRQTSTAKRQTSVAFVAIVFAAITSFVFAADSSWNTPAPAKVTWRPARPASNDTTIITAADASPVRTAKYEEDIFDDTPATPSRIKLNPS